MPRKPRFVVDAYPRRVIQHSRKSQVTSLVAWLFLFFVGLSLGGCQMAHIPIPDAFLSESSELPIEGRSLFMFGKSFQFGSYHITDIHRGWTKGKSFSILGYKSSEAEQKYEFSFNESDRTPWVVQCTTEADWDQLKSRGFIGKGLTIELSSNRQLACTLEQENGEKLSKLVMGQSSNEKELQGRMTDGATQIEITSIHKLSTSPFPASDPTGFMLHVDGQPVGAVEVINKGRIWMNNSVTPEVQRALAATSAVLLLYQDIKKGVN
jgi:hypothetical protein